MTPEAETPKTEVRILYRRTVDTFPKIGQKLQVVRVTFIAGDRAPSTIWIPAAEYSKAKEKAEIQRYIKEHPTIHGETFTLD